MIAGWLHWVSDGRKKYLADRQQKEAKASAEAQQAVTAATAAMTAAATAAQMSIERLKDWQRDEIWKAKRLRLCPHCKRPVEKIEGCSRMVCGRDANDKGGGNRQAGCFRAFDWGTAEPYRVDPAVALPAPSPLSAGAREVRHFVPGTRTATRCDVCLGDVVGPLFECVHCPGRFTVCARCEPTLQPATAAARGETRPAAARHAGAQHRGDHAFLVRLESAQLPPRLDSLPTELQRVEARLTSSSTASPAPFLRASVAALAPVQQGRGGSGRGTAYESANSDYESDGPAAANNLPSIEAPSTASFPLPQPAQPPPPPLVLAPAPSQPPPAPRQPVAVLTRSAAAAAQSAAPSAGQAAGGAQGGGWLAGVEWLWTTATSVVVSAGSLGTLDALALITLTAYAIARSSTDPRDRRGL